MSDAPGERCPSSNSIYTYSGNQQLTGSYVINGLNQYTNIAGQSVTYDNNGNLTQQGGTTYIYDDENRLVSTSGSVVSSLKYDPLGRLFETIIAGTKTQFLYDGDALVGEYDSFGIINRRYVHGDQVDEPWLQYNGNLVGAAYRRFLHADHQGSIIAHSSNSGAVLNSLAYDAYGIPKDANIDRFGYTGQMWLKELGLFHYKARIYSPKLGRFLQTDPVGYEDQMNLYAYVGNDPVNMVDPTGEVGIFGAAIGMALEIGVQYYTGELSMSASSLGKIAVAGVAGAVGAGIGSSISRYAAGAVGRTTTNIAGNSAAGAAIGSASKVASNAIDGKTGASLLDGAGKAAVFGAATGAAAGAISDVGEAAAKSAANALPQATKALANHIAETTGAKGITVSTTTGAVSGGAAAVVGESGGAAQAVCNKNGGSGC